MKDVLIESISCVCRLIYLQEMFNKYSEKSQSFFDNKWNNNNFS